MTNPNPIFPNVVVRMAAHANPLSLAKCVRRKMREAGATPSQVAEFTAALAECPTTKPRAIQAAVSAFVAVE